MRKKNSKIQILAGNTLMPIFHDGFEIELPLEEKPTNFALSLDTWDKDRLTPLHWATRNGHYEVVRCLIDHQARVDAKHFYTLMTPVHFAAANGILFIIIFL